jgi:hypothetical protein
VGEEIRQGLQIVDCPCSRSGRVHDQSSKFRS